MSLSVVSQFFEKKSENNKNNFKYELPFWSGSASSLTFEAPREQELPRESEPHQLVLSVDVAIQTMDVESMDSSSQTFIELSDAKDSSTQTVPMFDIKPTIKSENYIGNKKFVLAPDGSTIVGKYFFGKANNGKIYAGYQASDTSFFSLSVDPPQDLSEEGKWYILE